MIDHFYQVLDDDKQRLYGIRLLENSVGRFLMTSRETVKRAFVSDYLAGRVITCLWVPKGSMDSRGPPWCYDILVNSVSSFNKAGY